MPCNKPYSVVSNNPKMSGSAVPKNLKYGGSYKDGGLIKSYEKGGSVNFPDLTGDGKVTRADVLKGRGVFKDGGMVKSYQKGGMVTMPRMTAKQEMMSNLKKASSSPYSGLKSKKDEVARAEMKERIMGPQEKRKGPGTYTPQAWREREMEMSMPERELRKKSK